MKFYIGNTDIDWYHSLHELSPEDMNFWQPGGSTRFRAIESGSPFLLKLKSPINKIAGVGFFSSHSILPIDFAWEVFHERNGVSSYQEFIAKIKAYRGPNNTLDKNPRIGCIVLTNPVFFNEADWIQIPENWSPNIVQGKTFSTEDDYSLNYWSQVDYLLTKYSNGYFHSNFKEGEPQYEKYLTKIRIGQGAFRVAVTDAYSYKCAVCGERTLPVLEAAHIIPYSESGINKTNNGMLLRSDLHKLFDKGYITITDKFDIEISKRIKEQFENGRDYYKYHGKQLVSLPSNIIDRPQKDYLRYHNEHIYRG